MMAFKSLVVASAAFLLFQGTTARVTRRNGTPAGPFCTDFTPFGYAGCFTDPGSPRALPFSSNISSNAMTTETCVSFCKGNGYRYAGLEYYGECWCGASVAGVQVADSNCNFPCNGNKSEACGGNSLLSVYQDPTFAYDNTSVISDYTSSGCWTEGSSGRTLVYRQNALDTTTLTVEKCLYSCKAGGYPFAGVEYGGECYCGVVLGNGTMQVDSSQCNMACNGNSSESCGGSARLNLYVAADLESSQPCKNLSPSPPVSSSKPSTSSSSPPATTPTTAPSSPPATTPTTAPSSPPATTPTTAPSSPPATTPTTAPSSPPTTTPSTTMQITTATMTTSSAALCTTTIAPTCEYSCGSWCSSPLPTWSSSSDCMTAASHCLLQVAACFSNAKFPDSLKCFQFSSWCHSVSSYCSSNCAWGQCSKDDCKSKYPPAGPSSMPTTSVYACPQPSAPITTNAIPPPTTTTCTSVPVPTSSNICQQPHNPSKGYSSNAPCGGIALPCLTCNNLKSDYDAGSCFKLYTFKDSTKCSTYKKPSVSQGCKDACLSQHTSCIGTYAESCKSSWKREASANPNWGWGGGWGSNQGGDDYETACQKCDNQYSDCLTTNAGVTAGSRCSSWNSGWY